MEVKSIDHVCVAVHDMKAASAIFERVFGATKINELEAQELNSASAVFRWGGIEVSLNQPLTDDSSLARFLAKRGNALHHIGVEVDDVATVAAELEAQGVELVDKDFSDDIHRSVIVAPKHCFGILLQIVDWHGECKHSTEARVRYLQGWEQRKGSKE